MPGTNLRICRRDRRTAGERLLQPTILPLIIGNTEVRVSVASLNLSTDGLPVIQERSGKNFKNGW